jgi:hypothetical protein
MMCFYGFRIIISHANMITQKLKAVKYLTDNYYSLILSIMNAILFYLNQLPEMTSAQVGAILIIAFLVFGIGMVKLEFN